MAAGQLPSRVALDVHEGATICPVLSDVPVPLLEQLQMAGCELLARDNGDVVVYTPHGGDGYTIPSFFEHFPQLYSVLDLDSLDQFNPFLDEETASLLLSRAEEAQTGAGDALGRQGLAAAFGGAAAGLEAPKAGVTSRASSAMPELQPFRHHNVEEDTNARSAAKGSSGQTAIPLSTDLEMIEEMTAAMKETLKRGISNAEKAIERSQHDYKEGRKQVEVERQQIAEERARLDKEREELAQKEQRLQKELEEVDRLRSEIDTAAKSGKKGFLWC